MRKRIAMRLTVLAVIALVSFLILRANTSKQEAGCKESMEECCQKKTNKPTENILFETISKQFISLMH